jgi:hypothetical protein
MQNISHKRNFVVINNVSSKLILLPNLFDSH